MSLRMTDLLESGNPGSGMIPILRSAVAVAILAAPAPALAVDTLGPDPKVSLRFNRLYDYGQLTEALKALVAGHPDLLTLTSLGKSVEGRDMWYVTINDKSTGSDT